MILLTAGLLRRSSKRTMTNLKPNLVHLNATCHRQSKKILVASRTLRRRVKHQSSLLKVLTRTQAHHLMKIHLKHVVLSWSMPTQLALGESIGTSTRAVLCLCLLPRTLTLASTRPANTSVWRITPPSLLLIRVLLKYPLSVLNVYLLWLSLISTSPSYLLLSYAPRT